MLMKFVYPWLADHLPKKLIFEVLLHVAGEYYNGRRLGGRSESIYSLIDWYGDVAYPNKERA